MDTTELGLLLALRGGARVIGTVAAAAFYLPGPWSSSSTVGAQRLPESTAALAAAGIRVPDGIGGDATTIYQGLLMLLVGLPAYAWHKAASNRNVGGRA